MGMEYYDEYTPEDDVNRICVRFNDDDDADNFELYGYDEE